MQNTQQRKGGRYKASGSPAGNELRVNGGKNTIKKGVFAYENDLYGCGGGLRTKETHYEGVRTSAMRPEASTSFRGGFERWSNAVLALRRVTKAQSVESKFDRCQR